MRHFKLPFLTYSFIYALWTVGVYNTYFWRQVWSTVSPWVFVVLILMSITGLMIFQSILFARKTVKPLSILLLITNSIAGYFITAYHLVLNKTMLMNILDTNFFEATEWMGISFWVYVILFGIVPSIVVWRLKIEFEPFKLHFRKTLSLLAIMLFLLSIFLPYRTSVKIYLKTNFNLRYQFVPTGYVSGVVGVISNYLKKVEGLNTTAGMEFHPYWKGKKKNLFVFVLGESARDANFSLSGYRRNTAEPLQAFLRDMIVFKKTESCGVVTRVSVPCMFNAFTRENYKEQALPYTTNALDILSQNGIDLLWLDNELGCNKVCRNIQTEYTCETRDCVDMLLNDAFRDKMSGFTKDTFVVLHQRGSHGPRYDLRVPAEYKKWKPYCDRADSTSCAYEELVNTYDNTMYYTSLVIADLIKTLSKMTDEYNPVLMYISDHGESLGEGEIYGHGGDFKDAPDVQKQVPFFVWMPKSTRQALGMSKRCMRNKTKQQQTQDAIFHSILGWAGISTDVYDEKLDIFAGCHH
ncbi:MAG: sulfatase-like hydrolase/transferase [Alphaproteobacteria bacterium]|nr:sulfatase-like hydrolase/transferase [Alphaproteobacteria bacterium]